MGKVSGVVFVFDDSINDDVVKTLIEYDKSLGHLFIYVGNCIDTYRIYEDYGITNKEIDRYINESPNALYHNNFIDKWPKNFKYKMDYSFTELPYFYDEVINEDDD